MRKCAAILVLTAALAAAGLYLLNRQPAQQKTAGIPTGPAPALPPGFPPTFPGSSLQGNHTNPMEGGWTRAFDYTVKAKADDIIAFYRKALTDAGLQVMAEGGGPYGGMLRAQAKDKKQAVYVDVEAPEDKPDQVPKITVTVVDSQ